MPSQVTVRPIHHWIAHLALLIAFIGAVTSGFGLGVQVQKHLVIGSTATRPGVPLVPGTKPVIPSNVGLGGAARISALSLSEGLGANYCTLHNGSQLGAHYRNVYTCAPAVGAANAFDSVGFQCVELSVRYTWAVYGRYLANVPDGRDLVSVGHAELGVPVGHPGRHIRPVPGDILSLWGDAGADPFGHTAVVTHVGVDNAGNGTIQIMEENGSASGLDTVNVRNWSESYGDPNWDGGISYYPHIVWLQLGPRAKPHPLAAFPARAWNHWRKGIPWHQGQHVKLAAKFWLTHRWLGAPTARATYHPHGRYETQTFRGTGRLHIRWIIYFWPNHPKWTPSARRRTA